MFAKTFWLKCTDFIYDNFIKGSKISKKRLHFWCLTDQHLHQLKKIRNFLEKCQYCRVHRFSLEFRWILSTLQTMSWRFDFIDMSASMNTLSEVTTQRYCFFRHEKCDFAICIIFQELKCRSLINYCWNHDHFKKNLLSTKEKKVSPFPLICYW